MGGPSLNVALDGPSRQQAGRSTVPRQPRSTLADPSTVLRIVYNAAPGGCCSFCQIRLAPPGQERLAGETAEAIVTNPDLPNAKLDPRGLTLACPSCAIERNPKSLSRHLSERHLKVLVWNSADHPSPEQVAATTRAMVASIDELTQESGDTLSTAEYQRYILEAFETEGLLFSPIWQADRSIREPIAAMSKEFGLTSMPRTDAPYAPTRATSEEELWTGPIWEKLVRGRPSFWKEHRDRFLLIPHPDFARNPSFSLKDYWRLTQQILAKDPERMAYLSSRYNGLDPIAEP